MIMLSLHFLSKARLIILLIVKLIIIKLITDQLEVKALPVVNSVKICDNRLRTIQFI